MLREMKDNDFSKRCELQFPPQKPVYHFSWCYVLFLASFLWCSCEVVQMHGFTRAYHYNPALKSFVKLINTKRKHLGMIPIAIAWPSKLLVFYSFEWNLENLLWNLKNISSEHSACSYENESNNIKSDIELCIWSNCIEIRN